MKKQIGILLVEDNELLRGQFENHIHKDPDLVVVGQTDGETEAMDLYEHGQCDVIILDLELKEGDGVHFLQSMQRKKLRKPYVVVLTNNSSHAIQQCVRDAGADFICQKSNSAYTPGRVLDLIKTTYAYHDKEKGDTEVIMYNQAKEQEYRYNYIIKDLEEMGFKLTNYGTKYVASAIYILAFVLPGHVSVQVTKHIYPKIAEENSTTIVNVEKNIRDAIERTWSKTDVMRLERFYPYVINGESGSPTNSEFIRNMATKYIRK